MNFNEFIDTITTWGSNTDFLKYSLFTTITTALTLLIAARIINHIFARMIQKHYRRDNLKFVLRLKTIAVYIIALYAVLDLFQPFQTLLKTLLASGGVIAVVIGLAAQEAAGNFINGLMIVMFKPFKIGDLIKINNGELIGTVEDISLRHTVIKTFENTKIIVPNSVIDKAVLENVTAVNNHKGNFLELEISYESDLEKAMQIISEEVKKHPDYLDGRTAAEKQKNQPEVIIRLVDFAESGLKLKATVYSENNAQGYAMLSDIRIAIKKRFDEAGIEIPYPHRSVILKQEHDKKNSVDKQNNKDESEASHK